MDCRVKPANDGGWVGANACYYMKWPRIRSRRTTAVSPWVSIIAREVEFARGAAPQTYHAVEQADYISIVALTPSGKIPIVRQYRPALPGERFRSEEHTSELQSLTNLVCRLLLEKKKTDLDGYN